jgi:hypothetical protein
MSPLHTAAQNQLQNRTLATNSASWNLTTTVKKKVKISITSLWGPESSGRLRLPDSVTSALESVKLSALGTGRLYPQQYLGTHFKRLSRSRAH